MSNVMVKKKDVRLVEFVNNVGGVEENCGMPMLISIVHGNILDVEKVHIYVITTHSTIATYFTKVEVM